MRLDEKSARKIARGRLQTIREDTEAACRAISDARVVRQLKPNALRKTIIDRYRAMHGKWLLGVVEKGRKLALLVAAPMEDSTGHVEIFVDRYNLRSCASGSWLLLEIREHAIARLLERARDVELHTRLRFELRPTLSFNLIAMSDPTAPTTVWPTASGEFRCQLIDGVVTAMTWIPRRA